MLARCALSQEKRFLRRLDFVSKAESEEELSVASVNELLAKEMSRQSSRDARSPLGSDALE